MGIRVVEKPKRRPDTAPKRPPWPAKHIYPVGTVVEYDGVLWELDITGAADQSWREWVEHHKLEAERRRIGIRR